MDGLESDNQEYSRKINETIAQSKKNEEILTKDCTAQINKAKIEADTTAQQLEEVRVKLGQREKVLKQSQEEVESLNEQIEKMRS